MKKLVSLLSGCIIFIFFTGCTSVKRYKSASYKSRDNTLVDMELFSAEIRSGPVDTKARNLWDLSASAQTQLIQILDERYEHNGQFISSLSNDYLEEDPFALINYLDKDLTMVFTISRHRDFSAINESSGRFSPADRIEYLKFSLEIPDSYHLYFKNWNRYVTEYGEIDIADVSFSKSLNLSSDFPLLEKGDGGLKSSFGKGEEQEIKSRYLKLNGSISKQRIEIEEEGNREIDLTGNVIADVSLEFDGFPERITIPLFAGEKGEGNTLPELSALKHVHVLVPRMDQFYDTLWADLTLQYIYRHVQSGWLTYPEWDDRVEYYSGSVSKEVPLLAAKEFIPVFYCITSLSPRKQGLKIRSANGPEYLLQFKDYLDASGFFQWLSLQSAEIRNGKVNGDREEGTAIRIGDESLWFDGKPLSWDQVAGELDLQIIQVSELYGN